MRIILTIFLLVITAYAQEFKKFIAKVEDGVQRVYIKAGSYYYDPNYIVVKRNIPVEFVLIRESAFIPHNIVLKIPQDNIDIVKEIYPDEEVVVRFTPRTLGKFMFYCDKKLPFFPSHKEKGMWGILEVVD